MIGHREGGTVRRVYDITTNTDWLNVGTDVDAGAFAGESIWRWWKCVDVSTYPHCPRLTISAGYRLRLWRLFGSASARRRSHLTNLVDHT